MTIYFRNTKTKKLIDLLAREHYWTGPTHHMTLHLKLL